MTYRIPKEVTSPYWRAAQELFLEKWFRGEKDGIANQTTERKGNGFDYFVIDIEPGIDP